MASIKNLTSKWLTIGVDVILDSIGGPYYQRNLDSLNLDGRLFLLGFMSGTVTQVDLKVMQARRLTVQCMYSTPCLYLFIIWNYHLHFILPGNVITSSDQNKLVNQFGLVKSASIQCRFMGIWRILIFNVCWNLSVRFHKHFPICESSRGLWRLFVVNSLEGCEQNRSPLFIHLVEIYFTLGSLQHRLLFSLSCILCSYRSGFLSRAANGPSWAE